MDEEASRRKQNTSLLAQDGNDFKHRSWGLQGAKCRQNTVDRGHNRKNTGYYKGAPLLEWSTLWGHPR